MESTDESKIGGDYWRQAIFYHILYTHKYPQKQINKVEFQFIFPNSDLEIISKKVIIKSEEIEFVKNQIKEIYKKIKEMRFEGCGKDDCSYCSKLNLNLA